jgi:uncharacterized protein involved in exopolysaccharide biosynthesis
MPAISEDAPTAWNPVADEGRSLSEHLQVLRRRRGLLIGVLLLLLALSAAIALLLPAVYRSTATILIKEQEIPQELVRSTVTSYADERIQVISQQVMTRSTLLGLAERHGLYAQARQRATSEEILDRMRRDIKLTPVSAEVTDRRTGAPVRATIAFTLSYDSEEAASAQKIANELTTLFLNENIKNRQEKAAETTSFLEEELARVSSHIGQVEQQLSDFKQRHQGRTPDLALSNVMANERTELELQRVERELAFMADRQLQLQAQLSETRPQAPLAGGGTPVLEPDDRLRVLQLQLAQAQAQYSDSHPDVRRLRREIATLQAQAGPQPGGADRERELRRLKEELAQLRQRYAEQHPDVQRLQRTLQTLEMLVRADSASGGAAPTRPDNPLYLSLRAQLETTGSQLQMLRAERSELQKRRADMSARVSQSPDIERQYLELVRDLDTSRARFRDLRDKSMQAQVAEQLERSRKAERFTVIEPPIYPERPHRPNRQLIMAMGAVLALVGAVLVVYLREALDQTVGGARDLVRVLQVPVLAVLPVQAQPVSAQRRARVVLTVLLVTALLLSAMAAGFHQFVMPLDVAGYGLLRRLGL